MFKNVASVAAGLAAWLLAVDVAAYRPFDGTDANVSPPGEFELELGPMLWSHEKEHNYLLVPSTVLNLGIVSRLELVVDFRNYYALSPVIGQSRNRLLNTDAFLKYVLRRGVLQEANGPSIAIEAGPLAPEIGGRPRFGAHANVIVSERGRVGAVHLNQQFEFTRDRSFDSFTGVILEGPSTLAFRPVSEFYFMKTMGGGVAASALFGAIWVLSDSFSLDGAVRGGRADGSISKEYRLGFTWVTQTWHSQK